MKLLLISGHGAGDPGAVGINGITENSQTIEVVNLLANRFAQYSGIEVAIYPHNRNAYKDIQNGTFAVDLANITYALEIHFNANGSPTVNGSECYVTTTEAGISVEQKYMVQMDKYFKLRDNDNIFDGVKRTNFAVINYLKSKGISGSLLETCFITGQSDMNIYLSNKANIANDLADSIATSYGYKINQPVPAPTEIFKAKGHVQDLGWGDWGLSIGTTGQSRRLEAFQIDTKLAIKGVLLHLSDKGYVQYSNITKDTVIGTIGEHRRIEAIEIDCPGLEYRVHQEGIGWTSWTNADGVTGLGSAGQSLRIEAIEFRLT